LPLLFLNSKKNTNKFQIQILDTRHKHPRFKLQFKVYLVPTKPLVVPETIRLLILSLGGHTVYTRITRNMFLPAAINEVDGLMASGIGMTILHPRRRRFEGYDFPGGLV
jgi:hypothetical protein